MSQLSCGHLIGVRVPHAFFLGQKLIIVLQFWWQMRRSWPMVLVTCIGATHKRPVEHLILVSGQNTILKAVHICEFVSRWEKEANTAVFLFIMTMQSHVDHIIASVGLELLIFPPVPLQCWDHRHAPPCLHRSCDLLQNTSLQRLTRKNCVHKWLNTWNTWKPAGFWRTDSLL